MELATFAREYWRLLVHATPEHPTVAVAFRLDVESEALTLAKSLKRNAPGYNQAVLTETARLLNLDALVVVAPFPPTR